MPNPVSFARDIVPLFRPVDIANMLEFEVRLGDYSYMADPSGNHRNARRIGAYLSGARQPRMPLGGPFWTDAQLQLFERWMNEGFQP